MRRSNLFFVLACILCLVTAAIGFGGESLTNLFRGGQTAQALTVPPSTAPEPDPQRDESKITVYVTDTGERYHRASCQHLRRSSHAISLKNAKQQGYTPCKVCRPAR